MATATGQYTEAPNDQEIQRDALCELTWDARLVPHAISVTVRKGVALLTGQVDSYPKRKVAERVVGGVPGVQAVVNELQVRLDRSCRRSDDEIVAAASRLLQWDAVLPNAELRVSVCKGWVTLDGEVEWQFQKQDLERLIERVTGVRGIENRVQVRPHASAAELKHRVQQALMRSAGMAADHITVEVNGSQVILEGCVPSIARAQEAVRAALMAPGVSSVDDRLALS